MSAIWKAQKQYHIEYESDKFGGRRWSEEAQDYVRSNIHDACNSSTLRGAKTVIARIRKEYADDNPRNFKVYDTFADVDPLTNYIPCIYSVQ